MAQDTPFGRTTRMRVLEEYFAQAGAVTEANAWEHVNVGAICGYRRMVKFELR